MPRPNMPIDAVKFNQGDNDDFVIFNALTKTQAGEVRLTDKLIVSGS